MTSLLQAIEGLIEKEFDLDTAYKVCEDITLSRECTCDELEYNCVFRDEKYCAVRAMKYQFNIMSAREAVLLEALKVTCEAIDFYSNLKNWDECPVGNPDNSFVAMTDCGAKANAAKSKIVELLKGLEK